MDALLVLVVEELVRAPHREAFAGCVVLTAVFGELVLDWPVLAALLSPSGRRHRASLSYWIALLPPAGIVARALS